MLIGGMDRRACRDQGCGSGTTTRARAGSSPRIALVTSSFEATRSSPSQVAHRAGLEVSVLATNAKGSGSCAIPDHGRPPSCRPSSPRCQASPRSSTSSSEGNRRSAPARRGAPLGSARFMSASTRCRDGRLAASDCRILDEGAPVAKGDLEPIIRLDRDVRAGLARGEPNRPGDDLRARRLLGSTIVKLAVWAAQAFASDCGGDDKGGGTVVAAPTAGKATSFPAATHRSCASRHHASTSRVRRPASALIWAISKGHSG